jgi:hypothetical protein
MKSIGLVLSLIFLLFALPARANQKIEFAILRDGTPIGTHRVEIEEVRDETQVHVSIVLDIGFGFIPLYAYRHESREIWRNGRLISIESHTDDNGRTMTVSAHLSTEGLRVAGSGGNFVAPAETVPTSYWNPAMASERPLLDTQVGRILKVTRVPLGPGRWRLQGDLNLEINYSADGSWTGLRFHHKGSEFVYVPQWQREHQS